MFLLLEDIVDWALFTSSTNCFIKANLLGRDVELQNRHLVLFKSPRDVMQFSTLSAQLGLRSELTDWYRDATSVLFCHFFNDLSPQTDDRLRFCTNNGSILSKFCTPGWLKQSKLLDDEHTKSPYSPSRSTIFSQIQKSFRAALPKRLYQARLRMYSKISQRKPAKHIKTSSDKISKRSSIALSKKNDLEAKKRRFGIRKKATTHKSNYRSRHQPFVLIWRRFVLFPASVYNNKSLNTLAVSKQELPKYQADQTPTYQIDSLKNWFTYEGDKNKNLF